MYAFNKKGNDCQFDPKFLVVFLTIWGGLIKTIKKFKNIVEKLLVVMWGTPSLG